MPKATSTVALSQGISSTWFNPPFWCPLWVLKRSRRTLLERWSPGQDQTWWTRATTRPAEKLGVLPTMMPYYVTMYWRSKYFMYITITKMKLLIFRIFPSTLRICEGFSWDASATQVWVLAGSQWDLSHPKLISSIIGVGGQFDLQARQEVSGPQPAMALWDLQAARGTGVFQNIRKIGNHLNIFEKQDLRWKWKVSSKIYLTYIYIYSIPWGTSHMLNPHRGAPLRLVIRRLAVCTLRSGIEPMPGATRQRGILYDMYIYLEWPR